MTLKRINWTWLLVGVLMATSTWLWFDGARESRSEIDSQREQKQSAETAAVEGADLADQVIAACERDDPIGQSVREAGLCKTAEDTKDTVVDTLDDATPIPAPSPRVASPSTSQVLAAVTVLLPPALRDAVAARIGVDLAAYCASRNDCAGPAAPPAKDGQDGVDGETPSREFLLSLIQPLIPAPIPGADGVSVLAITCTSPTPFPVSFDFALSNGTTQSVSCPVVVEPEQPLDPAA